MLQACLNGGRTKAENAAVPVTAEELAEDAVAVRAAGADVLHVHPRDAAGEETLEPSHVARCLTAIRRAVPGMPVGVGTGTWIKPGGRARHDHIRHWLTLPDFASVNLNEDDAPKTMDILMAKGIGVEAGVWNRQDAERFVALPQGGRCLRILVEMTEEDPQAALAEYRAVMAILAEQDTGLPVLVHGAGASAWTLARQAGLNDLSLRIGLEDTLTLPDGRPAPSNAALVEAARELMLRESG